jgi:hypothetical protein
MFNRIWWRNLFKIAINEFHTKAFQIDSKAKMEKYKKPNDILSPNLELKIPQKRRFQEISSSIYNNH